ncbi:hypothetical protein ACTOB_003698 [Actinoplanes oblitus]|uniref:Uncharacterized protein n=1 Tax=Actinoplanes oblitus TaxID=3040509 RepID=A0ABY8WRE8_9ACTN|nr:hypothetical protein [Actinoplanes oblitus]WIN00023.1 hypothetical protein ACTOB_003698 [Actinoplanes oblitus]
MTTYLAPSPLVPGQTFEAVQALTVQLHDAKEELALLRDSHEQQRAVHEADIALIGGRLRDEATERGWCSIYDRVVQELNQQLTIPLPVRERLFYFDFALAATVTATALTPAGARAKLARTVDQMTARLDHLSGVFPYPPTPADWPIKRRGLTLRALIAIKVNIDVTAADSTTAADRASTIADEAVTAVAALAGVTVEPTGRVRHETAPF